MKARWEDDLSRILKFPRENIVDVIIPGKDLFTSSLPYAISAVETGSKVQPGDIGLVINVGAGLQVGCAIYYF